MNNEKTKNIVHGLDKRLWGRRWVICSLTRSKSVCLASQLLCLTDPAATGRTCLGTHQEVVLDLLGPGPGQAGGCAARIRWSE